jgi:hypothetical protein
MSKIGSYIENSSTNAQNRNLYGRIDVIEVHPLESDVDILTTLKRVEEHVPSRLAVNVEVIYIGDFEFLKEKQVNAAYQDGAIYVSNKQDSEEDLLDDLVHELSHATEEAFADEIYADGAIRQEFLAKRTSLHQVLGDYGYEPPALDVFVEVEYSELVDTYLYSVVGYEALSQLTMGVFVSPYGATSMREYFANSFEEFVLGEPGNVEKIAPSVFEKVLNLFTQGERDEYSREED